jgi:hypothetical protein
MEGCGVACVLFIWLVFLWPILVTAACIVWKKKKIEKVGLFAFLSILIGYAILIGLQLLSPFILDGDIGYAWDLIISISLLFPVITTFYLSTKFLVKE